MQVKVLTLRYSPSIGAFDDSSLQALCRQVDLVDCTSYFFQEGGVPHLTCVVQYQERPLSDGPAQSSGKKRFDPRELEPAQQALFDRLRGWRRGEAEKQGVPPYIVLTNRVLADVVRRMPDSLTGLSNVSGIGPAKVRNFGKALLALLGEARGVDPTNGKPAGDGEEQGA